MCSAVSDLTIKGCGATDLPDPGHMQCVQIGLSASSMSEEYTQQIVASDSYTSAAHAVYECVDCCTPGLAFHESLAVLPRL